MSMKQRVLIFCVGAFLGMAILLIMPRPDRSERPRHPWHAQTAPEGYYPQSAEDGFGRSIQFTRQPRWMISLAPSVTEILFALDLGDHLMAVTDYCDFPEEARQMQANGRTVGRMDAPDLERIAEYGPDLVLGSTLTDAAFYRRLHNPPRTLALALRHESLESLYADIALVARVVGLPGHGNRLLTEIRERIAASQAQLPLDQKRRKVLYLLDLPEDLMPGFSPGQGTWVSDLIESCHAENVTSSLAQSWGVPSREALIGLAPDVLILQDGRTDPEKEALRRHIARLPDDPLWRHIPAVREQRIALVDPRLFAIPSPRVPEMIEDLTTAIWGDIIAARAEP